MTPERALDLLTKYARRGSTYGTPTRASIEAARHLIARELSNERGTLMPALTTEPKEDQ